VGRLDPVKNLDGLFMAFKRSIDLFSDKKARLLVVGDGQELPRLKDLSKALGLEKQVYFSGMRNDVGFCLSAMDVYVQPSFYEGHSNTILEAMASGIPVISTHVGGTPEIVTHGDSGFLFKPGDTEEIAMAIAELRNNSDKRGIMAEKGRQKVKDLFSVDTMVKNYIGLFDELLR
jgi:glycosyltransferase involved in cell wall biosynthesis